MIAENVQSYLRGYKLGGSPQRVASAELRYSGPKLWLATLSVNYAGDNYVSPSPIRRMKRICDYAKPINEVFAKRTTITGLEPRYVGVLIGLEGVQFLAEELSFSWCDEGTAATRHLIDQHGNTLQVRTVADALFANDILPQGNGYIEGILSYFNGNYQLRVFSGKNVFLTGERF